MMGDAMTGIIAAIGTACVMVDNEYVGTNDAAI